MNKSQKTMEWLTCFSVVNLTLGCLLFKKFKKFNESCSFSKAARISERTQTWCAAEIPDLSTSNCFKKDTVSNGKYSFTAPSMSAIQDFNMFQKDSVNPKSLYPNSYLLLTSTSFIDLQDLTTKNCFKNC